MHTPTASATGTSSSMKSNMSLKLATHYPGFLLAKGSGRLGSRAGYDVYSTLEIAGDDAVLKSYAYLKVLGAE